MLSASTSTPSTHLIRAGRPFGVSLTLVGFAITAFLIPGWSGALQLERGGNIWSLFTGHFTHWNTDHFLWDLITFVVLAMFCESKSRVRFLACVLISAIAISIGFLLFETELSAYRGLSGIDSALYALAMFELFRSGRKNDNTQLRILAISGLIAFLVKTIVELETGTTVFVTSTDFVPVTSAHLIGFACGVVTGLKSAHA